MNLGELWAELEAAQPTSSGIVERRLPASGECELYVGVRKPGNTRVVIARVRGASLGGITLPAQSRGISTGLLETEGAQQLDVTLNEPGFAGVFDVLVEDLGRTMATPATPREALERLVRRIRAWQQFFASANPEGLNDELVRGLYGELWFMREHLVGSIGADRAVAAWKGSSRTDQDFQMEGCAVEVKTTGTKQPQLLRIASERQLDTTGVESLVVCHISVDVRDGGGQTLPQLVAEIRAYLAGPSVAMGAEFEEKLLAYGYNDVHAPRYQAKGFTVRQSNLFEVRGDFPRILEADLRTGVGEVQYSIVVDTLRPFAIASTRLRGMILGAEA